MDKHMNRILAIVAALIFLLLTAHTARAQPNTYAVPRWTVDSGGGRSSAGTYKIDGIAGQPEATTLHSTKYTISGGFWSGAVVQQNVYVPLAQRGDNS